MQSPVIEPMLDTEQEYRTIEAAMLETPRGRWFLAEHGRRSRRIETSQLEDALAQLKSSLRDPPAMLGRLQTELNQIKVQISEARSGLLTREAGTKGVAENERPATASLLKAAEELHELIWSLQAKEFDGKICEQIGRQTAAIFALTARQAQESRRVAKIAESLDAVSTRVAGALETVLHELNAAKGATDTP